MIRSVIFSRDRALQLDGLLQSIRAHAAGLYAETIVIYKASSREHARAYADLFPIWPGVRFWSETSFHDDLPDALRWRGMLSFHADDDLFYGPPPACLSGASEWSDDGLCWALRLGRNTVECQPLGGIPQAVPSVFPWLWKDQAETSDFGYPFSIDGSIYSAELIRDYFERLPPAMPVGPNDFEHRVQALMRDDETCPPYMTAPEHSVVVSVPLNRVNEGYANPCADVPAWRAEGLLESWRAGLRIAPEQMDFRGIRAAHQVVAPVLVPDQRRRGVREKAASGPGRRGSATP